MGQRGLKRAATIAAIGLATAAVLARPLHYEVDGLSMGPGLLPGDIVTTGLFPAADRLRRPRRFDRWILAAADGSPAIKRVVGLPGEAVSILEGDLAIDGRPLLTPPQILAETASAVPEAVPVPPRDTRESAAGQRTFTLPIVLDDAAFAPEERRVLLPVRDVGLAATIHVSQPPSGSTSARVIVCVGDRLVPWRFQAAGRYAVVAGRLDGHLVGVAWPIATDHHWPAGSRSCLPRQPPASWDLATLWPDNAERTTDSMPTSLELRVTATAVIQSVIIWRDILRRPAADGITQWQLGPDTFFVLGDFPAGSRDSRHWGPLSRDQLRMKAPDWE